MIFMTEILYLVFEIFINEAIAQFQTLINACNRLNFRLVAFIICMHMYGCELWNLSSNCTDKHIIAWRKIWKIPINSHKHIVHNLSSDCKYLIEKHILKSSHNGLNSNSVFQNFLQVKLTCKNSCLFC